MARTRKTGAEMVQTIFAAPYDPNFLVGYLAGFLGRVVDGQTVKTPKAAARQALEALADPNAFLAATPSARKRGA